MDHNHPFGMGFIPIPPWAMALHSRNQQTEMDRPVPRRVHVAIGLIHHMSHQISSKIAANDVAIQEIEGRTLEVEEKEVFVTSCKLLVEYLKGNYKETKEERAERNRDQSNRKTFVRCFQCGGAGGVSGTKCGLCEGYGSLACEPANPGGSSEDS